MLPSVLPFPTTMLLEFSPLMRIWSRKPFVPYSQPLAKSFYRASYLFGSPLDPSKLCPQERRMPYLPHQAAPQTTLPSEKQQSTWAIAGALLALTCRFIITALTPIVNRPFIVRCCHSSVNAVCRVPASTMQMELWNRVPGELAR